MIGFSMRRKAWSYQGTLLVNRIMCLSRAHPLRDLSVKDYATVSLHWYRFLSAVSSVMDAPRAIRDASSWAKAAGSLHWFQIRKDLQIPKRLNTSNGLQWYLVLKQIMKSTYDACNIYTLFSYAWGISTQAFFRPQSAMSSQCFPPASPQRTQLSQAAAACRHFRADLLRRERSASTPRQGPIPSPSTCAYANGVREAGMRRRV